MKKRFLSGKKYLEEGGMGSNDGSDSSEEDIDNRSKDHDYIPEKPNDTGSKSDTTVQSIPLHSNKFDSCGPSDIGIGNSSKGTGPIIEEIMEEDRQTEDRTAVEVDSISIKDCSQSQSEEIERDEDVGLESIRVNQLCIFCCQKFISKQDLLEHLQFCNPVIFYIIFPKDNQCLVCRKKIPSFSLGGVIRHAITCVIEKWVHRNELGNSYTEQREVPIKTDKNMPILEPIFDSPVNAAELEPDVVTSVISNAEESKEVSDDDVSSSNSRHSTDFSSYSLSKSLDSAETLQLYQESQKHTGGRYSDKVKSLLKQAFMKTNFPTREVRQILVEQTGLNKIQIKKWFQAARRKQNRHYSESVDDYESLEAASHSRNWLAMNQRKVSEKYEKCKEVCPPSNERRGVGRPVGPLSSRPRPRTPDPTWSSRSRKKNRQRCIFPGNKASGHGSSKTAELLMPLYLQCNEPDVVQVMEISQATGLHVTQIRDWFRRRRNQRSFQSSEPETLITDQSSPNPVAEEDHYTVTYSSDEESVLDQGTAISLQNQSARKKAAEIKKIPKEQIRSYVLNLNSKVTKLFKLFTDPLDDFRRRDILAQETELIESIGSLNNPFIYEVSRRAKLCGLFRACLKMRHSDYKN